MDKVRVLDPKFTDALLSVEARDAIDVDTDEPLPRPEMSNTAVLPGVSPTTKPAIFAIEPLPDRARVPLLIVIVPV